EPDAAIELEWLANAPGLSMEEDAALTQLVKQLTQTRHSNKVSYGTEAGLFQQAGIPTIVCGPGSIEQAHRPNEFVELSQLAACEHFLH
ncbi:M20/M25/M40 family metallo-hydrolase, partial [Acinetobacter baumannii]